MKGAAPADVSRDWAWAVALVVVGVGTRVGFSLVFPTLPFWDFLQIVHFGALLRDHGLVASGWYWSQFNPGLPSILAFLFRVIPGDPIAIARTATAVVTGLLPLLPFLLWRRVIEFRWRLLTALLVALWPGQILFSGAIAQDNWILVPTIALASLAVRRLLDRGDLGYPILGGLLYTAAIAIRQEMGIVLLPVALAAASAPRTSGRRARNMIRLAITASAGIVLLAAQRHAATGRFSIVTEHGALGLFGSFVPGASVEGWIDARAYAAALEPRILREPFGSQRTLLELTWAEARRRPAFHLLRIAAWIPRLALNADADNLFWSLEAPRAQAPDRRARAAGLRQRWAPWLKVELALVQGLFVAAVVLGLRRRNPAILVLSLAVLLKFLIHALVSPLGRMAVPAIALELLVIPLGIAEWVKRPSLERRVLAALALAAAGFLALAVPALTDFVTRRDSPILPGVGRFTLHAEDCDVRCRLESGAVSGLGRSWAQVQAEGTAPARLRCELPLLNPREALDLRLTNGTLARVGLDGRWIAPAGGVFRIAGSDSPAARAVTIEGFAPSVEVGGGRISAAPLLVELERRTPVDPSGVAPPQRD